MNLKLVSALAAGLLSAAPAFSDMVTLDFEGAGPYYFINGFYNGGTNEGGASGTNFGASFGPAALAVSNDPLFPIFSNAPTPGTIMSPVDSDGALNVALGFESQASFFYSSTASGTVGIYSGLNGTGSLLGSFALNANAQGNGCSDTTYCFWQLATVNFSGVARSIQFGSAPGAGFDNVTINPVPLPAAAWLLLSGLGGLGTFARRKRNV